ncbi:MAG: substrate-binding domain-containing protein, partial [Thermoguttaceae bacterium]
MLYFFWPAKKTAVLMLYCGNSQLQAAEELSNMFYRSYGIVVQCVTIDEHAALKADQDEKSDASTKKPTRKKKLNKKDPNDAKELFPADSEQCQKLSNWVSVSEGKNFSQFIEDHRFGDLYLCDSEHDFQQLTKGGFVSNSRTVAYLKPVLLVRKGNPKSWQTLADVLGSGA